MAIGPSPNPDYMDELALFTHGEFICFTTEDPELLLFTHGEFPRPAVEAEIPTPPTGSPGGNAVGSGAGRARLQRELERRREEELRKRLLEEEAIALALLAAIEEDDDWF